MQMWEKQIDNFDRSLRRRMKRIKENEIPGLEVDRFIRISTQDPELLKEYLVEEIEEYLNWMDCSRCCPKCHGLVDEYSLDIYQLGTFHSQIDNYSKCHMCGEVFYLTVNPSAVPHCKTPSECQHKPHFKTELKRLRDRVGVSINGSGFVASDTYMKTMGRKL